MMPNWKGYFAAKNAMPAPVKDVQGYGYQYANLAQVKSIVDPACADNGIGYTQYQEEGVLHTKVLDAESGETMVQDSRELGAGSDQQRGSSETYQRRYALLTVFGLAPEDDDGRAASVERETDPDPLQEHKARLWAAVRAYADKTGGDAKALAAGCTKRADHEETAEWYAMVAEEFEGQL